MAKTAVALRLAPDVLVKVDAYASARKVSRQVVLETFVLSGLDDSGRGVVDLVAPEPVAKPKPARQGPTPLTAAREDLRRGVTDYRAAALARQANLNAGKERAS